MAPKSAAPRYNVFCIAQRGRLEYEAIVFVRSFRAANPDFTGRLIVCEPSGKKWPEPVAISEPVRALLNEDGAEILSFDNVHFGADYPNGNKIEAMAALPAEPFVFFDTDTLFTGPLASVGFDFDHPSASMKRENTWPDPPLYGPGYTGIWKRLYDQFDLDFESSLDQSQPDEHWERYLYFNAGWFFGKDAQAFGKRFMHYAHWIRWSTPDELACQSLDPWLDQIALPLVIHSFGGKRPGPDLAGLDGDVTCHYRYLSLLYARESDLAVDILEEITAPNRIKKVLRDYEPAKRLIYQRKGRKLRAAFDRANLPRTEKALRKQIQDMGLWLR